MTKKNTFEKEMTKASQVVKKSPDTTTPDTIISALNSKTESWRLDRLNRVLGYAAACADFEASDLLTQVKHLHDHKGILSVGWRGNVAYPNYIESIHDAWEKVGGEPADSVRHYWEYHEAPLFIGEGNGI